MQATVQKRFDGLFLILVGAAVVAITGTDEAKAKKMAKEMNGRILK